MVKPDRETKVTIETCKHGNNRDYQHKITITGYDVPDRGIVIEAKTLAEKVWNELPVGSGDLSIEISYRTPKL